MPNRLLLMAADNKRLEGMATQSRLTKPLVERYVAGRSLSDALHVTEALNRSGLSVSLDLLGESVSDLQRSEVATQEYLAVIAGMVSRTKDSTVSVKLSQLGVAIDSAQCEKNLRALLAAARENGAEVEVDMEHSSVGRETLAIFQRILPDYPETRLAIQANMRQTPEDLFGFTETKPKIRLVKGAFDESVGIALHDPEDVTSQYNYLAIWALRNLPDPAFGTHDGRCIDVIKRTAQELGIDKSAFEFQMLHGVRRALQEQLVREGYRVRIYLPYGTEWYPYLMRRMAEKPGNLLLFLRSLIGG